jgi:hypothetical protein
MSAVHVFRGDAVPITVHNGPGYYSSPLHYVRLTLFRSSEMIYPRFDGVDGNVNG